MLYCILVVMMHLLTACRREALAAVQEAIHISQEMNDPVCLQHALVCGLYKIYFFFSLALQQYKYETAGV